jgi:hypothetical protein
MAALIQYSTAVRNARLDAITTAVGNAGLLRVYDGSRPANPAAAITGNLLAEVTMGSPFAAGAAAGVLSPTVPQSDLSCDATGTATHFRIWKSDGTTACIDGNVGTSSADLIVNTVSFVAGGVFTITAFAITTGNA